MTDDLKSNVETRPSLLDNTSSAPPASEADNAYPPQLHAGAVGYGPEYAKGASAEDKFQGFKEEMKGKMLRKPDLVQHGHEMRTGEIKRKHMEEDFGNDGPVAAAVEKDEGDQVQAATTAPEGTEKATKQQQGHNTDKTKYMGAD